MYALTHATRGQPLGLAAYRAEHTAPDVWTICGCKDTCTPTHMQHRGSHLDKQPTVQRRVWDRTGAARLTHQAAVPNEASARAGLQLAHAVAGARQHSGTATTARAATAHQ